MNLHRCKSVCHVHRRFCLQLLSSVSLPSPLENCHFVSLFHRQLMILCASSNTFFTIRSGSSLVFHRLSVILDSAFNISQAFCVYLYDYSSILPSSRANFILVCVQHFPVFAHPAIILEISISFSCRTMWMVSWTGAEKLCDSVRLPSEELGFVRHDHQYQSTS